MSFKSIECLRFSETLEIIQWFSMINSLKLDLKLCLFSLPEADIEKISEGSRIACRSIEILKLKRRQAQEIPEFDFCYFRFSKIFKNLVGIWLSDQDAK